MLIRYTIKNLEDIICYWIEATHISLAIDNIVENADEAGEMYEFEEWMQGDPEGESIMGIVDSLEDSSELAAKVMFSAEKKLRLILDAAIENDDKRLRKYKGYDYNKNMDEIMEELYTHFDEIYTWDKFEQVENFYRVLEIIMDGLME